MTIATHSITGAVIASSLSFNPPLALIMAFLSHFVLDSLPHWDYSLESLDKDEKGYLSFYFDVRFIRDLIRMFVDFCLGFLMVYLFIFFTKPELVWLIILGAILGALPDFLLFIYSQYKNYFLKVIIDFHKIVHTKKIISSSILGIVSQLVLITLILTLNLYFIGVII